MQGSKLLTLALLLCLSTSALGQLDWASVTSSTALQSGDGTFYGLGQDAQGTCSYGTNFANTNDLPWSTGTALTVAMNNDQFANTAACGMCIQLRGTGSGLGTTPIPSTWTMALVTNRCPECSFGDVDLAASGDGRWNIQWYAVPCNVGSTPMTYSIVVSSYYWFSMVVSNTRVPITSVSANIGGSWLTLTRSANNQWAYYNTNGPWQSAFPMAIKVTSITGETVQDTITSQTGNTGTAQFSADGSGGSSAASTATTTTASPPTPAATSASPPVAMTTPPAATPPASMPTPTSSPTPMSTPPSPALPSGSFYVNNYGQCGGTGGSCNTAPYSTAACGDAAWSGAVCNSGFGCQRSSAELWTCLPGSATPPTPATTAAPPTPATTPPSPASTTTSQTVTPPASPPPSTAATPPAQTSTASPPPGINPTTTTSTTPPSTGTPSPTPTQSAASTTSASTPPAPTVQTSSINSSPTVTAAPSTASLSIEAGGQCGGTSQCTPAGQPTDKVTCNNGPWAGAYCPSGYSCTANPGPMIWTCLSSSSSSSPAGRRLLEGR